MYGMCSIQSVVASLYPNHGRTVACTLDVTSRLSMLLTLKARHVFFGGKSTKDAKQLKHYTETEVAYILLCSLVRRDRRVQVATHGTPSLVSGSSFYQDQGEPRGNALIIPLTRQTAC